MAEPIDRFFRYGSQYYAAGRYAAFASLMPIAGNLLHHAVEMYLKGSLSKTMTREELKDKLGHKLPKIWSNYKSQARDSKLKRFDQVILSLHKFEEIRYPDKIIANKGWAWIIGIGKDFGAPSLSGGSKLSYSLSLEEVDDLAASIFDYARSKGYLTRTWKDYLVNNQARRYVKLQNRFF